MTAHTSKFKIGWTPRSLTVLFMWWLAAGRPAMLRHYIFGNLRNNLIKRQILRGPAKHVADIRAEFETQVAPGQFKELWFDRNILPWCVTFSKIFNRTDSLRILEIGSWEGRSTLFLLNYFKNAQLTAVDTWKGSDEWEYYATVDLSDLEARFDHNVQFGSARVSKRKGSSLEVLPVLLAEKQEFDLIYVDGSHLADDALSDAINSWRLLKEGGIMILDDVMWPAYARSRANTAWAVHMFLKFHTGEFKVLHAAYQVIVQKTKHTANEQPAEWIARPPVPDRTPDTHRLLG